MPKMSDGELLGILKSEEEGAVGYWSSDIATDQEDALDYYYGRLFGDEKEGRSKVVSRDVAETVDWMLPDLIRIFMSGADVVKFNPQGKEDEKFAEQATDYVNHVFWTDNPGFRIFHDWFKDALLQKNGTVKVYWDETEEVETSQLTNVNTAGIMELDADEEVEILASTEYQEMPSEVFPDGLRYDLEIKRTQKRGKATIEGIPPEEFLISRRSRNIEHRYRAHRTRKTLTELIEMGFDEKIVYDLSDGSDEDLDTREQTRFEDEDYSDEWADSLDKSMREVVLMEEYVPVDYDGDGVAELRQILRVDETILSNEEVDQDPFADITPIPMPHKHYGMSIFDQAGDLQRVNSTVWRQMLDNLYLANQPRELVNDKHVNMDDLLNSRTGGKVRTKDMDAVRTLETPFVAAQAFPMLEFIDQQKESRTGVSRYKQGLDPDALNKTATGINRLMDASQGRIELIARIFAETGVKTLFRKMLKILVANQDYERVIRLRNEWVPMNPKAWNADMDVTCEVGIGSGNKDQMIFHLNAIAQKQEMVMLHLGPQNPLVGLEQYYNTQKKIVENAGLKDADLYWKDPGQQQQQQQQKPDPKAIAEQQKQQLEMAKLKAEYELKMIELQADRANKVLEVDFQREKLYVEDDFDRDKLAVETGEKIASGRT